MGPLDDDLSQLSPEDLRRVVRWAEDRFVNAVSPLAVYLQMEMPGSVRADRTLQAAEKAVAKVLAAVDELRRLASIKPLQSQGEKPIRRA